jgi:hypothetical protein
VSGDAAITSDHPALAGIPVGHHDGFLVLLRALAAGASIRRMPGQLLIVAAPEHPERRIAFVHSVAESTRLATVTFVLQKRFRRALLEAGGVPIPPGATFGFTARRNPRRYAQRIGYPVVVKELFGENPSFHVRDVSDPEALFAAVAVIQRHLPSSSARPPSSYAQTINLSTAEEDDGEPIKSPRARYLIEKQLDGTVHRVFVLAGVSAMLLLRGDDGWTRTEPTAAPHVTAVAERAVRVISGIDNATVDVITPPDGRATVVEFAERLVIADRWQGLSADYLDVVDRLLAAEFARAGLRLPGATGRPLTLELYGRTVGLDSIEALCEEVGDVRLEPAAASTERASARIRLHGPLTAVAAVVEHVSERRLATYVRSVP